MIQDRIKILEEWDVNETDPFQSLSKGLLVSYLKRV